MKVSRNKNVSSKLKKKYDELVAADTDDSSPVTHVVVSCKETEQLTLAIHSEARTQTISIKMPGELLEELKQLASRDHIGYQTYIKFVLSQHVRKMREEKADARK
jgi:predicted DNA binding CopG/RHH family protein